MPNDNPTTVELFRLFLDTSTLELIAQHTNCKGQHRARIESSFHWQHDSHPENLEAYFGLLLGMGRLPWLIHY